jgi:hypothetical protein
MTLQELLNDINKLAKDIGTDNLNKPVVIAIDDSDGDVNKKMRLFPVLSIEDSNDGEITIFNDNEFEVGPLDEDIPEKLK